MAGLGYKDFTAGAVLTAAQVDGYLMEQAVMNFAGTAARGSALASVQAAGMVAHVGGGTVQVYNGSQWAQMYPVVGVANTNLLFNGAMQVAQRGTSTASITTGGYYTADRWLTSIAALGTWTQSVENDAPTGSGLRKSLKILCTTADAAPSASDYVAISQSLEGQDVQRICKGSSSAQQLTMSFWVKSNVTGTYIAELVDVDNSRRVSASYSVSASATWERKTITFPVDTTGVLDNDNDVSLQVYFWLAAGSTFSGGSPLQTTWGTATNTRATGQTNLGAATNNYWQVTGVQLEVGPVASSFEFKSYGQELRECQRYYFRQTPGSLSPYGSAQAISTTAAVGIIQLPVTMRVGPTSMDVTSTASDYRVYENPSVNPGCSSVPTLNETQPDAVIITFTVASGLTLGRAEQLRANSATSYIGLSSEL